MKYLGSSSKMIKLAALVVMASSVLLSASAEHHAIAGNYGNEDVNNKVADDDHSSAVLANNTEHPNAVSDGGLRGVFHQGRGDETQSEAAAREVSKFRSQPELEETKSKREDNAEFEFAEAHVGITSEGNGGAGFKALALVGSSATEAARDADENKLSTRDHTSPLGRDGSHTTVALNGGRVLASKNCADGYIFTLGDIGGWGIVGGDGFGQKVTPQQCADLCTNKVTCRSYEHSPTTNQCNLNLERLPTGGKYLDFNFCYKMETRYIRNANKCPDPLTPVTKERCLATVKFLVPDGESQGRTSLKEWYWSHVPPGCSSEVAGEYADYGAHWNSNSGGINNGAFAPICEASQAKDRIVAYAEAEGAGLGYLPYCNDSKCKSNNCYDNTCQCNLCSGSGCGGCPWGQDCIEDKETIFGAPDPNMCKTARKPNGKSCPSTDNDECLSGNCNRTTRGGNYECCASTWACYVWTSGCETFYHYCKGYMGH